MSQTDYAQQMSEHQEPTTPPAVFWEDRYANSERVWSGNPNATMASIAAELRPKSALDLGCGEGADAIWLAEQGAHVTAVDISPTAIERATTAARQRGLRADQVRFVAANLDDWQDEQTYDLVTASFLQSPVELDRIRVLRQASERVNLDGHLLIVTHAAMPPWASGNHHQEFPSPEQDIANLGLDQENWAVLIAEVRQRSAQGPDGRTATLEDGVILARRTA